MSAFDELSQDDRGTIVWLMLHYANGEEVEAPAHLRPIWAFIKASINAGEAKFEEVKEKRAAAGRRHKGNQYTRTNDMEQMEQMEQMEHLFQNGTNGTYQNQNQNQNQSPLKGVCVNAHARTREGDVVDAPAKLVSTSIPTQEEVRAYFKKINGTPIQADRFFNHWESVGWVRSDGRLLKSWEAAARQWVLDDFKQNQIKNESNGNQSRQTGLDYSQEDYSSSL